jgi:hypothetical protein
MTRAIIDYFRGPQSYLSRIKIFQNPDNVLLIDKLQYRMLIECSYKRDISAWNAWRESHPECPVLLEGADLSKMNLQFADFRDASLTNANFEDSDLFRARMESAWVQTATVNSKTSLYKIQINKQTGRTLGTTFRGVPFEATRIDSGTRLLLEYNVKRMNWEEWYNHDKKAVRLIRKLLVKPFWMLSDYGKSTIRLVATFLLLILAFSLIYSLRRDFVVVDNVIGGFKNFFHCLYFSVVTMTTLGFGDIHANPSKVGGLMLIILQVLSGYVLLGALITRLNILFVTGGPSRSFSKYRGKRIDEERSSLISNQNFFKHNSTVSYEAAIYRQSIEEELNAQ